MEHGNPDRASAAPAGNGDDASPPIPAVEFAADFDSYVHDDPTALEAFERIAENATRSAKCEERTREVFVYMCVQLRAKWPTIQSLFSFAKTVARRRASYLAKEAERHPTLVTAPDVLASKAGSGQTPEQIAFTKDDEEYMLAQLSKLPDGDKRILAAYHVWGTYREAAKKLGIPEATFRTRLQRVISKIQPLP